LKRQQRTQGGGGVGDPTRARGDSLEVPVADAELEVLEHGAVVVHVERVEDVGVLALGQHEQVVEELLQGNLERRRERERKRARETERAREQERHRERERETEKVGEKKGVEGR